MADDTVKEALDGVVKAIGFGIVSDYRGLMDSLLNMSNDLRMNTGLLDQVNQNVSATSRSLDSFQSELARQRERRKFKQAEDRLEGRVRLNSDRSEQSLLRIAKALENLQRQMMLGNTGGDDESGGGGIVDTALDAGGAILGGAGAVAAAGGAGAFLKGAAKVLGKTAIGGLALAGVTTVGAAGAYLMNSGSESEDSQGGTLTPMSSAAGVSSTPTLASDTAKMGAGVAAASGAAPLVTATIKSATNKALAKVAPRVPSYLSKFGGRIVSAIGLKSIPVFGALVGGYFSFSRFMAGDSWTAIGAEFVSGVAPELGLVAGPAGWVGGVATTLAIQTYLIARDIYQEENYIDIKNGVVPNFDDLTAIERAQVIKAVGVYVTAYVNNLIGRSAATDATTGVTPTSTSGAGIGNAAAATSSAGAVLTGAAAAGGATGGPSSTGASAETEGGGLVSPSAAMATTQAAADIAEQRKAAASQASQTNLPPAYQNIPQTEEEQQRYMQQQTSSPQAYPGASMTGSGINPTGVSPSDTVASINTSSDQTSMYSGGEYGPILDYLADSEGADYNTQFGYQNTTDGRPLTEMTVAEVMEAQRKQKGSSAIGRYQFMRQTMIDGLNAGIISQDEIFSPATQDRFATWLIDSKRKGNKWRAGKMSNEDFGRALSQEWASVPNPYTGASYYGQGIKHDVGTLMSVIQSAKGPAPMAKGGVITPLSTDKPKAGRDVSVDLKPPKMMDVEKDEDKLTSSANTIDARKKQSFNGSPKEKKMNTIATYMPIMSYAFGHLSEQFMKHARGEVTADAAFRDAMNPLS
jgi:muramidase (phage lysozyme)